VFLQLSRTEAEENYLNLPTAPEGPGWRAYALSEAI
jgi:hypothetical protein